MTQNQINRTSDTLFATTFDTNVAAAGVTLVGTTLSADGTDGNINVNINPKGTGYLATTKAGTVTTTEDFFVITNTGNAASMTGTGTAILFNQYYNDGTPAVADAGRIAVITEGNWTSTASTQDSYISLQTCLDGTVAEKVRITSAGDVGIGVTPTAALDILREDTGAYHEELYVRQTNDPGAGAIGFGISTSVSGILFRAYGSGAPSILTSSCAFIGSSGLAMVVGSGSGMPMYFYTNDSFASPYMKLSTAGNFGIGTLTTDATSRLELTQAGTVTATTNFLTLTNSGNAASMTGTGTAILFNQWAYDAATPALADAGKIAMITEGNWTLTAATQDSYMSLQTCQNGGLNERVRITSAGFTGIGTTEAGVTPATMLHVADANNDEMMRVGYGSRDIKVQFHNSAAGNSLITAIGMTNNGGWNNLYFFSNSGISIDSVSNIYSLGINKYPAYTLDVLRAGTAKANLDIVALTNSVNAADMDGTSTGILFNQYYYDAATPAVADAGRIAVITETDWTSTVSTQDSYMSFQTCLDGTVAEKVRINSYGTLLCNIGGMTSIPSVRIMANGTGNGEIAKLNFAAAQYQETLLGFSYRDSNGANAPVCIGCNMDTFSANTKASFVVKTREDDAADAAPSERWRVTSTGGVVYTPTSTQDIVAGTGITAAMLKYIIRVQGSGGAVTVTATPSIAAGLDGQVIIIQGDSDANTVAFQDESSLAGSKLQLAGGADFTLGLYDTLMLMYDANLGYWMQISASNN